MAPSVDRRNVERVRETVERQRAGERNHMAAIDQPPAETVLAHRELIEVDTRGVLIKPRRHLVLGFLHCDAIHMIDLFADVIIAEAVWRARKRKVIMTHDHHWTRFAKR